MDPLSMSASLVTIGALAAQIISIVEKAHELYSSVRNTPKNLRLLLRELSLLSTFLSGFKDDSSRSSQSPGPGFSDALEYCRFALESIQAFSRDLEKSINNAKRGLRQLASYRVTLSEKQLKIHLDRLERAKSMLSLAHQCCMQ